MPSLMIKVEKPISKVRTMGMVGGGGSSLKIRIRKMGGAVLTLK